MKNKLFNILFVVAFSLALIGAGQYGGTWKREGTIISPHDDVTSVVFGSVSTGITDATTLDGQAASYYLDSGNLTGAINYTGISNWDTAIGIVNADTGIDSHGAGFDSCKVTINASDSSKFDIANGCYYHIAGPKYSFAAITSIDPQFATGQNSRFIGVTMNGYTTQTSKWTYEQKQTIVPLARLNTPLGQLGSGSGISLIRDDRYFLYQNYYFDRVYHEEAVGAQYVSGGKIYNTGLQIGQTAGVLYDAQKKKHTLAAFLNQTAIFAHLSSNEIDLVVTKTPFTVDALNYNPAGSSLVPMANDNTFTIHTVLKSPKGVNGTQEGKLFFIYGDTEYATAAAAIEAVSDGAAVPRFTVFTDQGTSGLVCVALLVQQRNAATVDTILDRRPCQVCRP